MMAQLSLQGGGGRQVGGGGAGMQAAAPVPVVASQEQAEPPAMQEAVAHADAEEQAPLPAGHRRCRVAGCQYHLPLPAVTLQMPASARATLLKPHASVWSKHWQQQHKQRGNAPRPPASQLVSAAAYLQCHSAEPAEAWANFLVVCEPCGTLVSRHNKAHHERSTLHAKAVSDAAAAARAANLDRGINVVPPGTRPQGQPEHAHGEAYVWSLAPGTEQRAALDAITAAELLQYQLVSFKRSNKTWLKPMAEALEYVLRGLRTSHAAAASARVAHGSDSVEAATAVAECAAWAKLLHVLSCLLLVPDGTTTRAQRFMHFAQGTWPALLTSTLAYVNKNAARIHPQHSRASRQRNTRRTLRQPGGIGRTASALLSGGNSSSPRSAATLAALKLKHPAGPATEQLEAVAVEAAQRAAAQLAAPLAVRPHAAIDDTFAAKSVRAAIMRTDQGVSPGLSSLRISHLQMMIRYAERDTVEQIISHLVWMARTVFKDPDSLPDTFWHFFRAARLSAVGAKARPIACGDTLRRVFCRVFVGANKADFSALFEPMGQFGVAVQGGVDKLGLMAQLIYEAGGLLIAIDGRNAFNAVSRLAVLKQAALHVPVAYALIRKLYGDADKPSLMYGLEGQAAAELVLSAEGVQQGDPLGPLLFALVLLPIMQAFKLRFPSLSLPGFLDDLTICIVTGGELPAELAAAREAYEWLVQQLQAVGIEVNTDKTTCLLPADAAQRVPAEHRDDFRQYASERLGGVKVTAAAGMVLVGSPVGADSFALEAVSAALQTPAADGLLRGLAGMHDDTQGGLTLLRMCYLSRATFLSRNARPAVTQAALQQFDEAVQLALAVLMQEPLAVTEGGYHLQGELAQDDFDACLNAVRSPVHAPVTEFSDQQQALIQLPPRHGGFGLRSQCARRHAGFVARTVANIQAVLTALPTSLRDAMLPDMLRLPTLLSLRASVQSLHTQDGISREQLLELLPAELVAWSLPLATADADAGVDVAADAAAAVQVWLSADPSDAETPLPKRLQVTLCRAADAVAATRYRRRLGDPSVTEPVQPDQTPTARRTALSPAVLRQLALYNSMSSPGAAAFLTTAPSFNRHLSMDAHDLREAMRRWLGIERPNPGGLCPKCDAELTAEHARRCSRTGEQNARHHPLVEMVHDSMNSSTRVMGRTEDSAPFVHCGHPLLRMDRTWQPNLMNLKMLDKDGQPIVGRDRNGGLLDVSIIDQASPTNCSRGVADGTGPACKAGAAAIYRVKEKYDKYWGKYPANYTLIPFVLEQSGASSKHVQLFIQSAAWHEHDLSGGAWPVSAIVQRWRQKISVTLQKVLSVTSARVLLRVRDVVGREKSNPLRYQSVYLVRRPVMLENPVVGELELQQPQQQLLHLTGD